MPLLPSVLLMLEWVICGGGIHGVHLASRLLGQAKVDRQHLRIMDPGESLLGRWRACTKATGMTHLRSPVVHHLDLEPLALQHFSHTKARKLLRPFVPPYQRPALELFDAHCDHLIQRQQLEEIHLRAKVIECKLQQGCLHLVTSAKETYQTRSLIFAVGSGGSPAWPRAIPKDHPRISHLFDESFRWPILHPRDPVAILGGGISAGQVALRLLEAGHSVHVIARHPIKEHQFDSDPGWLGPKFMTGFQRETCMVRRRQMIRKARHRGSMPGDVHKALKLWQARKVLDWHQAEVSDCTSDKQDVRIILSDGTRLQVQHLLLATGFRGGRPGGSMVDRMIRELALPIAPCGFPVIDSALRWHPQIFVSGALAELELGPTARNIAGARHAGQRIVEHLNKLKNLSDKPC